jgi:hypothetical protein
MSDESDTVAAHTNASPQERAQVYAPLTGGNTTHLKVAADQPKPVKIKGSSVIGVTGVAASVICGAMIWGFVYTPMARAEARAKAREETSAHRQGLSNLPMSSVISH